VVRTILNNNGMSIRKTLTYSGCSKNMYYYNSIKQKKYPGNHITAAATVAEVTAPPPPSSSTSTTMIEKEIQEISLQRPTYGTRRMAAMLTRILGIPVNRKRVQRIFRKIGYITPSRSKKEILRSKVPNVKADRPNQIWEADLTYIHCVVLMDGATSSMYLMYLQENGLAIALICLQSRKMPSFLLKMLL
jgi:hypothetical protein